ncbi:hypothetical protein OG698_21240 [Streptomyces sp. NBC_01003]|uniref:hypothetical protein n=1 Tax=Streptomyces sp. NBC_01003 TaxID=2903714 RepID=UPI00386A1DBE|nr:hypothetical protein OG698_21240 [Streptomyces sp. NBC_01003]
MSTDNAAPDALSPDSPLLDLEDQLKRQGVSYRWNPVYDGVVHSLTVSIKSGRKTRDVDISEKRAKDCLGFEFTQYRALGDLDAFERVGDTPCIEVALNNSGPSYVQNLARLPGWELLEDSEEGEGGWVVRFQGSRDERWTAEIGSPSKAHALLSEGYGRAPTLRIFRNASGTYEESLAFLESVGSSILFEFDMNYGIPLTMRRARFLGARRARPRFVRSAQLPTLPRLRYGKEPLSLYNYARSATSMPLLQFLAYYQVLEYHFPRYNQRDLLDRLRNELRDPRFRPDDEMHLSRILRISQQSGRGYGDERSQLKATMKYSVSGDAIAELISGDAALMEHFSQKKPLISGAPVIDVKNKSTLVETVCDRIYHIRCLVVHSKEDGGGNADSLLLPFTSEADSVRTENELMRFLAQKVLIASAEALPA